MRGSTVNSEAIDDQQSTVRGLMVNSEVIDDQQSTVRQSTINTVDLILGRGENQVNSERVNSQQ